MTIEQKNTPAAEVVLSPEIATAIQGLDSAAERIVNTYPFHTVEQTEAGAEVSRVREPISGAALERTTHPDGTIVYVYDILFDNASDYQGKARTRWTQDKLPTRSYVSFDGYAVARELEKEGDAVVVEGVDAILDLQQRLNANFPVQKTSYANRILARFGLRK